MANVICRKDTGLLLLDFRYLGQRCREQTRLPDTTANRARLGKLADRITKAIGQGTFVYADYFPDSSRAKKMDAGSRALPESVTDIAQSDTHPEDVTPTFREFAELWFVESEPRWRLQYRLAIRATMENILYPSFGEKRLSQISRADVLAFRAQIAKRPGRAGQSLSAKSINKLMTRLKAILGEGCDRFALNCPTRGIKPLKQKRADIRPFSLDEVTLLINTIRRDYAPYLTVRCFTGLRTGEVNGLQWIDLDFERGVFRVERTHSRNGDGETKTELSKREIPMMPQVRAAFEQQRLRAVKGCPWVFTTERGGPIDAVNFTNRIWYPLLRYLDFQKRPPYQMRHTAATLMLAAGENPEWVAQILGHSTTEMLFRVYSRFVPNNTRNDGRAFTGLLNARDIAAEANSDPSEASATLGSMTAAQKAELFAELSREQATGGFQ